MVFIAFSAIKITAYTVGGATVSAPMPGRLSCTALMGIFGNEDTPTPSKPAQMSTMNVSALNTCETLCLNAPNARRMPISFACSVTVMYVMMPIII